MRRTRPYAEIELEDDNGTVWPLSFPERLERAISGMGMPPIKHWSTRAPYQEGETHWGYAVGPRIITINIYSKGCERGDMFRLRRENAQMIMPLNGPHKLRLITPEWEQFELHEAYYIGGYELTSQDQLSPRVQVGTIQLKVYDPLWKWASVPLNPGETRDVEGRSCLETDVWSLENELILPFASPFLLGTTTGTATLNVINSGTWEVAPIITVEGPAEDWILTNSTTGKIITWNGYVLQAGEIITINTKTGVATDASGNNMTNYIGGDIADFRLNPGTNALTMFATGSAVNGVTTIGLCWYVELIGV